MVCPQNVQYNSPNTMYISQKNIGDDTPGHPLTKCILYTTEICLFYNLCIELTKIKLLKI